LEVVWGNYWKVRILLASTAFTTPGEKERILGGLDGWKWVRMGRGLGFLAAFGLTASFALSR
jgi:hypothetical protein